VRIGDDRLHLASPYFDLRLSRQQPGFLAFSIDGLGQGKPGPNSLRPPAGKDTYNVNELSAPVGPPPNPSLVPWVEYRRPGSALAMQPGWRFEILERELRFVSQWSANETPAPLMLNFDPERCHVTLLGLMNDDGTVRLPAVLHIPNQGSLRITTAGKQPVALGYDAHRGEPLASAENNFIKISFPAATKSQPLLEYRLEITAIHPPLAENERAPELRGFQRNWLNVLQLNPRKRMLANNSTSDACPVAMYEYADIALHTPPLADGLTALDLVRQTLDRYLSGVPGYGLPGYVGVDEGNPIVNNPPFADTYPSLLIAVGDYVQGSGDTAWFKRNYGGVKKWVEAVLATDRDGNGLFKYAYSGNWNAMRGTDHLPANWWDDINYGHEDAYSNALAYRALRLTAAAADVIGKRDDAARWRAAADKLRAAYFKTFFNPATGVLAGWRSADGRLHDYWFLYISGIAIHYGLVPGDRAGPIMDRLTAKMKEVGFHRFEFGLPGNLVPVPLVDYRPLTKARFGGGEKADGSEGFQHYENGGATACFAHFTLAALYGMGQRKQADEILLPMLGAFDRDEFAGRDFLDRSKDWKSWDGAAFGYEGYLGDNYYALLSVLAREGLLQSPIPQDRHTWVSTTENGDKPGTALVLIEEAGKVTAGRFCIFDPRSSAGTIRHPPDPSHGRSYELENVAHDGRTVTGDVSVIDESSRTKTRRFRLTITLAGTFSGDRVPAELQVGGGEKEAIVFFRRNAGP
jgi:hypothetical protein